MNSTTRAKIEKKAAETVKARHAGENLGAAVEKVAKEMKAKADKPVKAEKIKTTANLPSLPKLPSSERVRKDRPIKACACGGCGATTKGTWAPGHDAYCHGWALRVERDVVKLKDVPAAHMVGVKIFLAKRKATPADAKPNIKIVKVDQTETEMSVVGMAAVNG